MHPIFEELDALIKEIEDPKVVEALIFVARVLRAFYRRIDEIPIYGPPTGFLEEYLTEKGDS